MRRLHESSRIDFSLRTARLCSRLILLPIVSLCLLSSCLTFVLNSVVRPGAESRLDRPERIVDVEAGDAGWLRLVFEGLHEDAIYEQCVSFSGNRLTGCPNEFGPAERLPDILAGGNEKAIYYMDGNLVFKSPYLKKVFLRSEPQFGFPTAIRISTDGTEMMITHYNRLIGRTICYHQRIEYETNRFFFLNDCERATSTKTFVTARRERVTDTVVFLYNSGAAHQAGSDGMQLYAVRQQGPNRIIPIHNVSGVRHRTDRYYLYPLYPVAFLLDVVTFPIQYLFWRPPNPLG